MDDRYRELAAKVDAFFARVHARHGDEMRCAAGCAACCQAGLTVTRVEADAIVERVGELDRAARARLRATLERGGARCAALDEAGRCQIYAARPIVCRSHGVPIRMRDARGLPVVDACALNFTARGAGGADADCVLDQTTLSTTLLAIDRAAGGDGARYDLVEVLAAALEAE